MRGVWIGLDISKIDLNFVEIFSENYEFACDVFSEKNPGNASPRKQKKIRKWINELCLETGYFPDSVMKYISKDVSNADYFAFMKACYDKVTADGSWSKQRFDRFSEGLDDCVKQEIWNLVNYQGDIMSEDIEIRGNDLVIDTNYGWSIERKLILKNAKGLPAKYSTLSFKKSSFVKDDIGYGLVGESLDYTADAESIVAIHFSDADVETKIYNATNIPFTFVDSPWNYMGKVTEIILIKDSLPKCALNEAEKMILPLLNDISFLMLLPYAKKVSEKPTFGEIKKYIEKYDYKKILNLVEQLSENYFDDKKQLRISEKLHRELDKAAYEPLWREIYNLIAESQKEYPVRSDECIDRELLGKTRAEIQYLMHENGYEGEYPDFYKDGVVKGIHIEESYGMTYFVGMEKKVDFFIHCNETSVDGHVNIEFLCGTSLVKRNNKAEDFYSCMFNAGGKRIFHQTSYGSEYVDIEGNKIVADLEQCVGIAIKKTELKKLTKSERIADKGFEIPYWQIFLFVFLIMGGFFAVCMTLGFLIIDVVMCIICGQIQSIAELIFATPWLFVFGALWLLFGGAMGIVTVIAASRK